MGEVTWTRRWRSLVPPSRAGRLLALFSLINAIGSGLWLTGSALFFTRVVGVTPAQVGLGLSAGGVVGLLTTMPVGTLVDRFGARRVAAGLLLWRTGGFVAYTFARGFGEFLAVVCLLGAADRVMGPVIQSLVSTVVSPSERSVTMGYLTATRNAGFTLGGVLASVMITVFGGASYRLLVLGNAASFVLALPVLLTLKGSQPAAPQRGLALLRSALPRDRPLLRIAAVNGLLVAHFTLLTVTIPLWVVTRTAAPKTLLGVLLAINTIGASLFQVPVSRRTSTLRIAARKYLFAGAALLLCCVVVAVTGTLGAVSASVFLVVAISLLTAAELTQSAAGWQVSFALAEPERRGSSFAAFSLGESAQTVIGPALLTALVVAGGWAGWLAVGTLLAAAGALGFLLTRTASPRDHLEAAGLSSAGEA